MNKQQTDFSEAIREGFKRVLGGLFDDALKGWTDKDFEDVLNQKPELRKRLQEFFSKQNDDMSDWNAGILEGQRIERHNASIRKPEPIGRQIYKLAEAAAVSKEKPGVEKVSAYLINDIVEIRNGEDGDSEHIMAVHKSYLPSVIEVIAKACPEAIKQNPVVIKKTPEEILSKEDVERIFNSMPDGVGGWLKSWGYQHFAYSVASAVLEKIGGE